MVALQDRYVTTEPFVGAHLTPALAAATQSKSTALTQTHKRTDWDYDFRIQKIGDNYRAFRRYESRISLSGRVVGLLFVCC